MASSAVHAACQHVLQNGSLATKAGSEQETCPHCSLPALAGFLSIAYMNGGPVSAVYGWIGVSCTNLLVALSMAEIVSAYPIAGGPYFW